VVNFELFRAALERAVPRSDRAKGGRPPFDQALMFKVLIVQASHSLSDERTEYLIKNRLSFMRFVGLGLASTVPGANTIWTFRVALTRAQIAGKPAIDILCKRFEAALAAAGFLAMGGQIIDASIVAASKQRNTDGDKREIRGGRIPVEWAKKPAKLRQKDHDALTVKYTKAKPSEGGAPRIDLGVHIFGYKNHLGIDHRHRLIQRWAATDTARHDSAPLPDLIDKDNTAGDVGVDTAYRLTADEKYLADNGQRSKLTARSRKASGHRGAPPKPMAAGPWFVPRSSTSSHARKARWACSSAPWGSPSEKQNRPRQQRLQHQTHSLARHTDCTRLSKSNRNPSWPVC